MEQRAYFYSDQLLAETSVSSCVANQQGYYDVVLAQTWFHPQGGGQPADRGYIHGLEVLQVRQTQHEVIHVLAQAVPLQVVQIEVLAAPRQLHSRLHTAGHLLANVLEAHGWRAVKAHHWPGEAKVVFESAGASSLPEAKHLSAELTSLIQADLPRQILNLQGSRAIAYGDTVARPCGGTHVSRSAEIGLVDISKIKFKQQQLSISYALQE